MRRKTAILAASLMTAAVILFGIASSKNEDFEERRERVLNELSLAIDDAISSGKYECCINPPCTMCYLGDWVWLDGTCKCDEMIAKGEFDKVCPQCVKGIEEGLCKSADAARCEI